MTDSNGETDTEQTAVSLPRTYTVSLLYYAELAGLKIDHSELVKESRDRGDMWLVSVREEVYGPMPLRDAFSLLLQGDAQISLLHESDSANEAATWREIAYAPWWSRPTVALLWTMAVGLVLALFGWMLVGLITPLWLSGPVQALYWIGAVIGVFLLCIPSELRVRIKERVLKRQAPAAPSDEPQP